MKGQVLAWTWSPGGVEWVSPHSGPPRLRSSWQSIAVRRPWALAESRAAAVYARHVGVDQCTAPEN